MKKIRKITCEQLDTIIYLIASAVLPLCAALSVAAQTAEQIAEKTLAATASLEMTDRNGTIIGFGSGFFVQENQIATNLHVVEGAAKGTAKLVGKNTFYNITGFLAADTDNDLVLLTVLTYGIAPLPLGNSDDIKIGATVYVSGNPKGLEGTFSSGIISNRHDMSMKKRLQMTAPVSPGSSGGPVLNDMGEVVGISYMTIEGGQNLNFAIPSNYLKKLLTQSGIENPLSDLNRISAETYFLRGNKMYSLELYKEAISLYNRAIYLSPDSPGAYHNRGLAKGQLKQYLVAVADYNKAIQLEPNLAEAYLHRGTLKGHFKQYSAAIVDYDKAIQLNPNLAEAYLKRGFAKRYLNRILESKRDFSTALRLAQQSGDSILKGLAMRALEELK